MSTLRPTVLDDDSDGLRLLGLGRIPRCESCPRYAALVTAHRRSLAGKRPVAPLPAVPGNCDFAACAALVTHFGWPAGAARPLPDRNGTDALAS